MEDHDCKVVILDGKDTVVSWTLGNAFDWEGAWDEYYFKRRAGKER